MPSPARRACFVPTEPLPTTRVPFCAYNPDAAYVDAVLAKAKDYRGAFAPGASGGARAVLAWAIAHVGRFTYNLGPPTDRGGSVQDMQRREPAGSTCDCSMFARWAFAQAGVDIGATTSVQWTANGLLPPGQTSQRTRFVERGVGSDPPPGGYQPADLIFFGVDDGPNGHVALWLGDGLIVQCSSSGNGSNIRPLAGYVSPWRRWRSGGGPVEPRVAGTAWPSSALDDAASAALERREPPELHHLREVSLSVVRRGHAGEVADRSDLRSTPRPKGSRLAPRRRSS